MPRLGLLRALPWARVLALAQVAILARRHLTALTPAERRRLLGLLPRARGLGPEERDELRGLVARLEPRAFAVGAAGRLSPVRVPRRALDRLARRRPADAPATDR